jgi:hypothetical protein
MRKIDLFYTMNFCFCPLKLPYFLLEITIPEVPPNVPPCHTGSGITPHIMNKIDSVLVMVYCPVTRSEPLLRIIQKFVDV